jgi:Protein of unknown function (DUF2442)
MRDVMQHKIYRVTDFAIVAPYTLRVKFDDETQRVINFEPMLFGELFLPLREVAFFNQVQLDREVHTLVWPNGADFDPATLHDWSELKPALSRTHSSQQLKIVSEDFHVAT